MDDDNLLKTLAEAARRRARKDKLDHAWDEHSAGQLNEEELAQLRQDLDAGIEQKHVEDAFAPLDDSFRNDVVSQLKNQLSEAPTDITKSDNVTQLRKPRFVSFPTALAASLLAALGLSLMLRTGEEVMHLPHYDYTFQGGTEYRSTEALDESRVFKPGERLQLILTPDSRTDQELIGQAYLVIDDQSREIDNISIEISASGAARLSGRIGEEIPVNLGANELIVVIGAPDMIPAAPQLQERVAQSEQAAGNGWQAWRIDFFVSDR